MDNTIETEEYRGFKIEIWGDCDYDGTPKESGDDSVFLTAYHRDFSVDGPCSVIPEHLREVTHRSYCLECSQRNFTTVEDTGTKCGKCGKNARVNNTFYKTSKGRPLVSKDDCIALVSSDPQEDGYPAELDEKYHFFGLEAYIHSGVVLALSNEGNFPDRQWDVSQLGLVFVSKKEFKTEKEARARAEGLIETWNYHLSGQVYGFTVTDPDGETIDSCGGFVGGYDQSGGPLEEARGAVDYAVKDAKEKREAKLKIQISNRVPLKNREAS